MSETAGEYLDRLEDSYDELQRVKAINVELAEALGLMVEIVLFSYKTTSTPGPDLPPIVTEAIRKHKGD